MYRAYMADGQILMLGVEYDSSTYVHLVETIHWNRLLEQDPEATYPSLDRPALGEFWDCTGRLQRGCVGDAICRLFSIRDYVDLLLAEVQRNRSPYRR